MVFVDSRLLGEPLLGPAGMCAVYVLTGIAGDLSVLRCIRIVGAGASGAVFGIAGVLILLLEADLLPGPPEEIRRLRKSVIYFGLLNFVIGGTSLFFRSAIRIDNMAHLGGVSLWACFRRAAGAQNWASQKSIRLSRLANVRRHVFFAAGFCFRRRFFLALKRRRPENFWR